MEFGDYIIFVDESGDHSLEVINKQYPIFVLAFCIFKKADYVNILCPKVQEFKFKWFGHDTVILHERDIRKDIYPFDFLKSPKIKKRFNAELAQIIKDTPMIIISEVIWKHEFQKNFIHPYNHPYYHALQSCMDKLSSFLVVHSVANIVDNKIPSLKKTHIIFEQRGGKKGGGEEDKTLEREFYRILNGKRTFAKEIFSNLEMLIRPKASNSIGLQIADLVARPIGLHRLRPDQKNKAYDIIKTKYMSEALPDLLRSRMKKLP